MMMSTKDVAVLLNTSKRTIGRLVHAGKIPVNRTDRGWRFTTTDIEALVARCKS